MELSPGDTVSTHDGQIGTVLEAYGSGSGRLEYRYPGPTGRSRIVIAYPVLLDGGEVRIFAAFGLEALRGPLQ
ncbi:MAG: hypothetical protein PIR02_11880 [Microbacterium enclense]